MNNQMISNCRYCTQNYCMECSEHAHWEEFCSEDCFDKFRVQCLDGDESKYKKQ